MTDDKRELNPHTGQPIPPEPGPVHGTGTPTASAIGTPGAAAASADVPLPAKQTGPPAFSSMPSAQELAVRSVLETVMDPELGLSVIDLGLIREIHFLPGQTVVRMMLTTPFCPYAPQLVAEVKQATMGVVAFPCEVEILPDAWSPDLMPDPGLLGFGF